MTSLTQWYMGLSDEDRNETQEKKVVDKKTSKDGTTIATLQESDWIEVKRRDVKLLISVATLVDTYLDKHNINPPAGTLIKGPGARDLDGTYSSAVRTTPDRGSQTPVIRPAARVRKKDIPPA
jgi:hypothetical protein